MNDYCELAKNTVEAFIRKRKAIKPDKNLPESFLKNKAGVFVSIHNKKELRGCVGTFLPTQENIAQEIISSSIAASKDNRFFSIKKEELDKLSYEVYILDEPKLITDIKELDPKKYGILVRSTTNNRSGLLLPDLEGVNDVATQIHIACQKAGIDAKREEILIYKFLAKKHVSS